MRNHTLPQLLRDIANQYPKDMVYNQVQDIPRFAFSIDLVVDAVKPKPITELAICDIGGGTSMFSAGCAAYGMKRVVLIDDFGDLYYHRDNTIAALALHRRLGVEIVTRNIVEKGIDDIAGDFDIITSNDSMEHWHHSPKKLFHQVFQKLKPGGVFVLSGPNCVNLRKRIAVPLGIGNWSRMPDWYETDIFRGHVREPTVSDLLYIARDMGLIDVKIYGRNWAGYLSDKRAARAVTRVIDYPLRLMPSLCSNIYMKGRKA